MKKLIALSLMITVSVWTFGPLLAGAQPDVTTSLTRVDGGTTGNDPIIKAVWEMNGPSWDGHTFLGQGTDDSTHADAQFNASGQYEVNMDYTVCAIATDPNGVSDVDGVYADIFYPDGKAFHYGYPGNTTYNQENIPSDDTVGNTSTDYGKSGCKEFIEENTLLPLDKMDGYNLFCGAIQNDNTNLPTFFNNPATNSNYDYNEICGATGELMKETAKVYCDDKTLSYEDPAGLYTVEVFAIDKSGNFSYDDTVHTIDYNTFEYLPTVGYEIDFSSVDYGNVALNSQKIVSGDTTWASTDNRPSVRNVGNERIYMNISQDDMGLGETSGQPNVGFEARVGNNQADWRSYVPGQSKRLEDILDLSETEEMDFSILVSKFPSTQTNYSGGMDLWPTEAPFRKCVGS